MPIAYRPITFYNFLLKVIESHQLVPQQEGGFPPAAQPACLHKGVGDKDDIVSLYCSLAFDCI